MRPNHLERYFKQQHKECFSSKAKSLKRMRLDGLGSYLTTSFEIAFLIAKQKKLHTIGKNHVS
nr:unnamed protein product [Callosobruchus analis]